jgi:hypothetical protein
MIPEDILSISSDTGFILIKSFVGVKLLNNVDEDSVEDAINSDI